MNKRWSYLQVNSPGIFKRLLEGVEIRLVTHQYALFIIIIVITHLSFESSGRKIFLSPTQFMQPSKTINYK